ncbi:amino acid/polyamine transporter I [Cenococcum geophilum]
MQGTGSTDGSRPILLALVRWDVTCLIINRMIGWDIFILPPFITILAGSKLAAAVAWLLGGIYTLFCLHVNLEYAAAWPFNGGEFIYISRVFTRPPLVFICSFAWFFVAFSTPVASSLAFAQHVVPYRSTHPNEWRTMCIASALIMIFAWMHYCLPRVSIFTNRGVATTKVIFLLVMILAGLVRAIIERQSVPWFDGFMTEFDDDIHGRNMPLAIVLVLYSYQGWQAADYVTSEIDGGEDQHFNECSRSRMKALKQGAYFAVSGVIMLYFSFNMLLFWLLDLDTIVNKKESLIAFFAMKVFATHSIENTSCSMSLCIAFSSMGNVISVLYTNSRVLRIIARRRLIPFYKPFQASSTYGKSKWDENGTPRGGLLLITLISLVTIATMPAFRDSREAQVFISSFFMYGHSISGIMLGIGFLAFYKHIRKRRFQNEAAAGTASPLEVSANLSPSPSHSTHSEDPDPRPQDSMPYGAVQFLLRWVVGMMFLCGNGLVVIMPLVLIDSHHTFLLTKPTWVLTVVVGSVYCAGALAAIYILTICVGFKFDQGQRPEGTFKHKLGWMLEYPIGNPSQFFKPSRPGCLRERLRLDEANLPTDFKYLASGHVGLDSTT